MTVQTIALKPVYNVLFNNMTKTVLLSQLVYWDGRKSLHHAGSIWFAKTSEALAEEIGHPSAKSIGNWLREFKKMGIIITTRKFFNGINQIWMSVNHAKITELLLQLGVDMSPNSPAEEHISESNLPQTELSHPDNSPHTDIDTQSNFPQTELSDDVTSLTGNSISKSSFQKESDQDQKDLIQRSNMDDDDFIYQYLSPNQIKEITCRVNQQIESRKHSANPIRNKVCYLKTALKNEADNVAAKQKSTWQPPDDVYKQVNWFDDDSQDDRGCYEPKPRTDFPSDDIWDAVCQTLKEQWSDAEFSVWIQPIRFESKDNTKYVIATPNASVNDWLQFRCYDKVKSVLTDIAEQELEIEFVYRPQTYWLDFSQMN